MEDLLEDMIADGWCVYWPYEGDDGTGPIYGPPEQINCRWVDIAEAFMSPIGQEVSKAKVFVGQDLTLQGLLRKDKLEDLSSLDNPFSNNNVHVIRQFAKIPATMDQSDDLYVRYAYL